MAKYEKTRMYVVGEMDNQTVVFYAPKNRCYNSIELYFDQIPSKMVKSLKVGKKVTFTRFSNQYTTWFAPKA